MEIFDFGICDNNRLDDFQRDLQLTFLKNNELKEFNVSEYLLCL